MSNPPSKPRWTTESLTRLDKTVIVVYLGGEVRGSIMVETEEEERRWKNLIEKMNV
jgi:CheY-specific phosphatase CheX